MDWYYCDANSSYWYGSADVDGLYVPDPELEVDEETEETVS